MYNSKASFYFDSFLKISTVWVPCPKTLWLQVWHPVTLIRKKQAQLGRRVSKNYGCRCDFFLPAIWRSSPTIHHALSKKLWQQLSIARCRYKTYRNETLTTIESHEYDNNSVQRPFCSLRGATRLSHLQTSECVVFPPMHLASLW